MGTILALAAGVLSGSADFLGGAAARRARPVSVLVVTTAAGATAVVLAALLIGLAGLGGHGPGALTSLAGPAGLGWGALAGVTGGIGLLLFYLGFSVAPMSVVAPVSALASTLLPLGVALGQGERLGPGVIAGGALCLIAVVLISLERRPDEAAGRRSLAYRLRGAGFGLASGVMFGLFFLFLRSAGTSGVLWPVALARITGAVLACTVWLLARGPLARSLRILDPQPPEPPEPCDPHAGPGGGLRVGRRDGQHLLRAGHPGRAVRRRGGDHGAVPGDDRAAGPVRARRADAPHPALRPAAGRTGGDPGHH